jgi:hypothetical protein
MRVDEGFVNLMHSAMDGVARLNIFGLSQHVHVPTS